MSAPTITDADLRPIREGITDPLLGPATLTPGRVVGRILERMDAAERDLRTTMPYCIQYDGERFTCRRCEATAGNSLDLHHYHECIFARFNVKRIEATV